MGYKTALVAGATFLVAVNSVGAGYKTHYTVDGLLALRLPSKHYENNLVYGMGGGGFPPLELAAASTNSQVDGTGAYIGFHQVAAQVINESPDAKPEKVERKKRRRNERVPNSLLSTQQPTTTRMTLEEQALSIAALDKEIGREHSDAATPSTELSQTPLQRIEAIAPLEGEGESVPYRVTSGYRSKATSASVRKPLVVDDSSGTVLATNMRNPSVPYLQISTGGCQHRIGEFSVIDDPLRQAVGMDGCIDPSGIRDVPQLSKSPWEATVILDLDGLTVAEAVKVVLSIPGYELLRHGPSVDQRTTRMLSLQVPKAQRRLRASNVREALELLAGPRIVIAIDHSSRMVAFDQSPVYASLKTKRWIK